MNQSSIRFSAAIAAALLAFVPHNAEATIVEFQTSLGDFEVNLYDNTTPATVTNFLDYVNNGRFTASIYHRSVPGFIVQGGAFVYNQTLPLDTVATNPAVNNEPELSNVRGTISMAKLGGDPNSATSQWFFNLADNSANLDVQNGGFTAFGEVVGNGMDVIDAIAALPVYNFSGATAELPLRNYTATDFANGVDPNDTHFVIISAVVVTDTTVDSAAGLNPTPNTLILTPPAPPPTVGGGGGGGSFGWLSLLALLAVRPSMRRARRARLFALRP